MAGYWTSVLQRRLSRRRAMARAAALGGGAFAATVLGCGGGDDGGDGGDSDGDGGETTVQQGLASLPADTSNQATRGGTMQAYMTGEGAHFDAPTARAAEFAHTLLAYSRLVRPILGTALNPPDGSVEGDAAEGWEWSDDGLKLTFTLRQGMRYEPREPVNGREINSQDVKFGWEGFIAANPSRGDWSTEINPDAPIESMDFPDDRTVVVNLGFPLAALLGRFDGSVYVTPVEADGGFDSKQEMRGSGPWMMTEYQPSVGWKYERNPNWFWADERPFLDGMDFALLSEPTLRFTQFQAQNIWYLEPSADDDVIGFRNDHPESVLVAFNPLKSGATAGFHLTFSKLPDSPLMDERVRHAVSLLLDRDAWIDTFFNVSMLEDQGVEMETAWNSTIACTAAQWLNPKANELGEQSQWFHHNPEEARKLLEAAGHYGVELPYAYATSGPFSVAEARKMEVMAQMLQQDGHFNLDIETGDFTNWMVPTYFRGRGQYPGIGWTSGNHAGADLDAELWSFYAPNGRSDTIYTWDNVPGLEELMKAARAELDDQKRLERYHELQIFLAQTQPAVMWPGMASEFNLYWPWMGNGGALRTLGSGAQAVPRDGLPNVWYDESKDDRSG